MKYILKLFKINKTNSLLKKSNSIVSVFTKTTHELIRVNEEITDQASKVDNKILDLKAEKQCLIDKKYANASIIRKIEEFLK